MRFAKNSDRPVNEPQVVAALPPRKRLPDGRIRTQYLEIPEPPGGPSRTIAAVASRPVWLWGAEHAVNAAGVAIGNEKVWTTDDPHAAPPALIGMDLVRLAAERATTAAGAVDLITSLLERHGQGGSGEEHADEPYWSSFLVVDPGGGWVVETSGRTWVAQEVGDRSAISNRLTVSRNWTRSSPDVPAGSDWQARLDPKVPTGIADHRLAATTAALAADPGPAGLVAALRDHGGGPWGAPGAPDATGEALPQAVPTDLGEDFSGVTVCMHVADYQCTTASMVADLPADPTAPLRWWASLGPTCSAVVLPGVILREASAATMVVPAALTDPVVWQATSALARAVEQPGDAGRSALEATRALLGPCEANAWAEADELVATNATSTAWRDAAARWSDRALAAVTKAHAVVAPPGPIPPAGT
jgi:hypothetical protein